ncbi:MAG: FAD-dependent monooxygenase [Ectothiorhodospiraceae bacterium]|nr:FAD-dependent monooxygenase [Ectothiorhodospiraceae bacterium]
MTQENILIVGAGLIGLATARALSAQGINFKLIEKNDAWKSDGAGVCLPANAVSGFEHLDLKKELLAQAHQVSSVEYAKANGTSLAKSSLYEEPLNYQPFVALRRSQLHSILAQDMESKTLFNKSVEAINNKEDAVDVLFNTGETETFDLVIGADGIHSKTRSLAFENSGESEFPPLKDMNVTTWRFTIQHDTSDLQPIYHLGDDSAFMLYPISRNEVYCYAQIVDANESYMQSPAKEILTTLFARYCKDVTSMIDSIQSDESVIIGRLVSVQSREIYRKRIVLVGDALHGCPPTLQQGIGLGVEDALLLAKLLSTHHIDDALEMFKEKRLERISWVIDESNRIIQLAAKGKHWLGRVVRNHMIRKNGPANVVGWKKLLQEDPLNIS